MQVLLQLIAFRTRPEEASNNSRRGCNGRQEFLGFSTNQIIQLSIVIAVLNLFKTVGTLYFEASSLEMGMMQYIRYFPPLRPMPVTNFAAVGGQHAPSAASVTSDGMRTLRN